MTNIAIVGSGIAGLHLGLHLRKQNLDVTIYTNRTGEEVANGPVMNSVAHMHVTRSIEEELGINHWIGDNYEYIRHYHYNGWGEEREYFGDFTKPSAVVDYRIMLPKLMEDFEERGGRFVYGTLFREDVDALTDEYDLVVVSAGKGDISAIFPKRPEMSPFSAPARKLAVGFWHGVERLEPNGVGVNVVPGVGELLAIPMWSFSGKVMALLFESVPGGPQEVLTDQKYADDPAAYREKTLEILREYYPPMYARINEDEFRLQGEKDILQGAFPPSMRQDFVELPNGKFLLALGDIHMTVDPVQAQGANSAAYSAKLIADAIAEDKVFDRRFMEKVARRRAERLEAATNWINTIIGPPTEQIPALFSAMVHNPELADRFTENFNNPVGQMDLLGSLERVQAAIESTQTVVNA